MEIIYAILILAGVVVALGMTLLAATLGAILILTPVALLLYIWRIIFPFLRSIAEWLTNPTNGLPFFLFMFIVLSITGAPLGLWLLLFYLTSHWAFLLLALLLIPIFSLALLINGVALGLFLLAILVKLNQHTFLRFRTRFLTTAFRIVMWRAKRKQEREERPKPRAKRRKLGLKRRRRAKEEPPEAVERPKPRAKRRKWGLKRRQRAEEEPPEAVERPKPNAKRRKWRLKRRKNRKPPDGVE